MHAWCCCRNPIQGSGLGNPSPSHHAVTVAGAERDRARGAVAGGHMLAGGLCHACGASAAAGVVGAAAHACVQVMSLAQGVGLIAPVPGRCLAWQMVGKGTCRPSL